MKKTLTVLAILALTGGGALAADKILKGDQFVVAGVNFPQPFQTPSGQVLKAGVYDLKVVSEGTEGVLIGLLKGGKQVGQLRGIVKALPGDQGVKKQPAGGPGMALPVDQGIKLQPTPRDGRAGSGTDPQGGVAPIDNKVQPAGAIGPLDNKTVGPIDNKAFRELGLTPASAVSFGGGLGKISNSNNLHPGAILPYIEFRLLPAVQK